ncbi:hypothetical protein BHE74_00046077 [Ensete ventricosum]|nr:hypothetical protein BHE74_00046077 [Ensete ventricosum]
MPMNLKEGDRYVVNHGEGLTTVDFGDYISLVEKESAGMAGMAGRGGLAWVTLGRGDITVEEVEKQSQKKAATDWRASARDAMATKRRKGSHNKRLPPGTAKGGEAAGQVAVCWALVIATHDRTRWSQGAKGPLFPSHCRRREEEDAAAVEVWSTRVAAAAIEEEKGSGKQHGREGVEGGSLTAIAKGWPAAGEVDSEQSSCRMRGQQLRGRGGSDGVGQAECCDREQGGQYQGIAALLGRWAAAVRGGRCDTVAAGEMVAEGEGSGCAGKVDQDGCQTSDVYANYRAGLESSDPQMRTVLAMGATAMLYFCRETEIAALQKRSRSTAAAS